MCSGSELGFLVFCFCYFCFWGIIECPFMKFDMHGKLITLFLAVLVKVSKSMSLFSGESWCETGEL